MVYSQKGQKSLALAGKTKESVDPIMLFDGWLESQTPPFRLATKRVYQFLWKRFYRLGSSHETSFLRTY